MLLFREDMRISRATAHLSQRETLLRDISQSMVEKNVAAFVPIFSKGEEFAFLALGEKLSGAIFSEKDRKFLAVLSHRRVGY